MIDECFLNVATTVVVLVCKCRYMCILISRNYCFAHCVVYCLPLNLSTTFLILVFVNCMIQLFNIIRRVEIVMI